MYNLVKTICKNFNIERELTDVHDIVYEYDNKDRCIRCVDQHVYFDVSYEYKDDKAVRQISNTSVGLLSVYGGKSIEYNYDKNGNCIEKLLDNGERIIFLYNSDNKRISKIYSNSKIEIRYIYDENKNLIQTIYPDENIYYKYDSNNIIEKSKDEYIFNTYEYNCNNLLIKEVYYNADGTPSLTTIYTYDINNNLILKSVPFSVYQTRYEYDIYNNCTKKYSNFYEEEYIYDKSKN